MSDFVTELRREVVGAHAQHRVAAVRTRRRRRRPILAGAVALAALLVAVVWAVRSIPPPERSAEPRVVKVVRIGGEPSDGVYAAGSLWVTDYVGKQIVRIDPARRKVSARIALDEAPEDVTAGEGRVWARGLTANGGSRIWAIDPATNRVSRQFDTDETSGIAIGGGWVWSAQRGHTTHAIERFTTAGRQVGSLPLYGPTGVTAAGRWVWAGAGDGTVMRIDARTGRVDYRWPHLAPSNQRADTTDAFAPDARGTWLLDGYADRIVRLEGRKVTRVIPVATDDSSVAITRARDGLWVVTDDEPTGSSIARVSPRTGKVTATVQLGTHYPRALVPVRGGLWVIAGDGTAVLIDT